MPPNPTPAELAEKLPLTNEQISTGLHAYLKMWNWNISTESGQFAANYIQTLLAQARRDENEKCATKVQADIDEVQANIDANIAEVRHVQIKPSDNYSLIKARDWLQHTQTAIRALAVEPEVKP